MIASSERSTHLSRGEGGKGLSRTSPAPDGVSWRLTPSSHFSLVVVSDTLRVSPNHALLRTVDVMKCENRFFGYINGLSDLGQTLVVSAWAGTRCRGQFSLERSYQDGSPTVLRSFFADAQL